ncbi:aminotransferase-like domain-containing protein [Sutcliffiella halmapala]|uniref:aminotransferase-like domain-containing protein n=1 Tax=Sutcliffiella halmapala TaxID=79882 RepID=UPI00099589E8|nr:PLP-dependent aminotransferase family protein [Sutcliffiella halmapala]
MWNLDRNNQLPIYQQIANVLEKKISYGEFPSRSKLPSERKLAEQLKVNRSTVVLAYSELRSRGIVETARGKGTIVSQYQNDAPNILTPSWNRYIESGNLLPNLPLLRRAREAVAQSSSIIDFASGKLSEDLVPKEAINEIMKDYHYLPNQGYDYPQGYLPLRQALVAFLKEYRGIQTTESSILITTSSQQALSLIMLSLLSPGDAIGVEDPSFILSLPMFKSSGIRIYRIPTDKYGILPEEIRTMHRKYRLKMLFLNPNFQNPTGTLLSPDRKKLLLSIVSELGLPIVEEDSFSLASFNEKPPPPLKAADLTSSTLFIGSFSKIAAAGLRIGWIVAPQSVIQRLADVRRQMDLGFNIIPQHIAAQFITSSFFEPHLENLKSSLINKRDVTVSALQREMKELVDFSIPYGGLHIWCKIIPEVQDRNLLDESIKRDVVFVPGSVYGSNAGYMRLTYARPSIDEIDSGITKLAAAIKASL